MADLETSHATIDHTGITGVGGSGDVATDAIWDAAGDLAVGSGANTAAKLSIGATNGMALQRVSGAVAWALPPGYEYDYAQITSNVTVTSTTEGSADTVVSSSAVAYDGSTTVFIEFYAPLVDPATDAAGRALLLVLYDGASNLGRMGYAQNEVSGQHGYQTMYAKRRLTPSAATHTYHVKAFVTAGTGTVFAGDGAATHYMPAFIRITRV